MEPWQGVVLPVMAPGWPGAIVTVTANVRAALVPHILDAVTEIVPPVAPTFAEIELVTELPDQPAGIAQL